jgi:molybdopterin-containing oxidoreductase family membrane subunit
VHLVDRPTGPYAPAFWTVIFCNCGVPQVLWSRRVRTSAWALFAVSLFVQLGMWLERLMFIVTAEHHDFLPSSWAMYTPTWIDWTILAGSISFFGLLFLLFMRCVPFIPISELKDMRRGLERAHG